MARCCAHCPRTEAPIRTFLTYILIFAITRCTTKVHVCLRINASTITYNLSTDARICTPTIGTKRSCPFANHSLIIHASRICIRTIPLRSTISGIVFGIYEFAIAKNFRFIGNDANAVATSRAVTAFVATFSAVGVVGIEVCIESVTERFDACAVVLAKVGFGAKARIEGKDHLPFGIVADGVVDEIVGDVIVACTVGVEIDRARTAVDFDVSAVGKPVIDFSYQSMDVWTRCALVCIERFECAPR